MLIYVELTNDEDDATFTVAVRYSAKLISDPFGTGDSPSEWEIFIHWVRFNGKNFSTSAWQDELIDEAIYADLH